MFVNMIEPSTHSTEMNNLQVTNLERVDYICNQHILHKSMNLESPHLIFMLKKKKV